MMYSEFQVELRRAGLTVAAFALLLGMNPNSLSNYAKAHVPQHLALIAVLLAELTIAGRDYRPVFERVRVLPKKARGRGRPGRFGGDPQSELKLGP